MIVWDGYAVQGSDQVGLYIVKVTYVAIKKTEIIEINVSLGSNLSVNVVVKRSNALVLKYLLFDQVKRSISSKAKNNIGIANTS
jgi:hypothetical protein